MNTTTLYELFRSDVVDTSAPYLWTDDEVYAYMNDAVFMFWRQVGGIADLTSEASEIQVSAGEPTAVLHPSILRIMSAERSDGLPLRILNLPDLAPGTLRKSVQRTGPVDTMVIGAEDDTVHWGITPSDNDVVYLAVRRLPFEKVDGPDQELALPEVHHIHLLKWMKSLAYAKQDAETFDRAKSSENSEQFVAYCDFAKAEIERKKHKTRVSRYGGL